MTASLWVHIGAGSVALLAGFTALFTRKGARVHRSAGAVFFFFMLITATFGSYIAARTSEIIAFVSGILTIYFAATAWAVVKREEKTTGKFEVAAFIIALGAGATLLFLGVKAARSESGTINGLPAEPIILMGSVALLAALLDISYLMRGGLGDRQRIARHLWRMSYALYIAAGSFFLGQAEVLPEPLQNPLLLSGQVFLILILMFFWLARVLFTGWWRVSPAPE